MSDAPAARRYAHGTFCWADLATSDMETASRFYTRLFGWSAVDLTAGHGGIYRMLHHDGKPIAGMFALSAEHRAQTGRSYWLSYAAVDDADAVAARAGELGGSIVAGPFDVGQAGRSTLIRDPQGALFATWDAREQAGAALRDAPGTMCWNELATADPQAAAAFYTGLFGWHADTRQMGDMPYTIFSRHETMLAGAYPLTGELAGMPPHWMIYFAVEDCDGTVARAKELGATEHVPPTDIPEVGRFAMLEDPTQAVFCVLRMD